MKWMESLAVRQGATEGLTTSADMEIGDVSEDDERLKNTGEYIPYGMKKEDWEKQKAKEEEQKRQRMTAQPPRPAQAPTPVQSAPPPPPPVQQPAASAPVPPPPPAQPAPAASQPAAASDTPDFDNMSPDEIMKWMESLAKRQGAVEGFTTEADMEVGQIAEDDERLKNTGEYIPFGMKTEDWEKQKAREEEQKRQRLAQQPPAAAKPSPAQPPAASVQPPAASFLPPTPPEPVIEPPSALDDFLSSELPPLDTDEEETVVAGAGRNNPVDWLTSVANEPDEFDFSALDSNLLSAEEDDPFKALESLSANDNNMDWLSSLGGDDSGLDALANLADLGADNDPLEGLDFLNQPPAAAQPAASNIGPRPGEDSLEWLESMARDHGATDEELMTPANLNVTRPNETRTDGPGYTPYSFETTNDVPDAAPVSADLDFLNEDEGSPEDWLDDVARGVATGELPTAKPPTGRTTEPAAAPEDEDVADDVMARLAKGHEVDPNDINRMFESFFQRAEGFAHLDEEPREETPAPTIPEDVPDEALKAEIPDWLRDQMIPPTEEPAAANASNMDALMQMFDEQTDLAEDFAAQSESSGDMDAMPDWLRQTPDDEIPALTSSEVPALEGDGELPDWLQATDSEGSDENIFADLPAQALEVEDDDLGELILESDELESLGTLEDDPAFAMDNDPWVVALTLEEEASDQLSQWYAEKTGSISGEDVSEMLETALSQPMPAAVSAQSSAPMLKAAQLPVESVLVMGEAQPAPDWLLGSAEMPAASVVMTPSAPSVVSAPATNEDDIPDWLRQDTDTEDAITSTDLDEIPDWLREQVDDSVVEGTSDLPPWLATDDVAETESDEIPDWLRETMAEEESASPSFTPDTHSAPTVVMAAPTLPPGPSTPTPTSVPSTPAPVPMQPAAIQPVKSSPAPQPVVNIDVASTLQAARGKVSSGDIEGSLADYEMIVRANTALEEVVKDLSKLVEHKDHKRNPALYRVLGDTLMRRGELKNALETYRKALHML